MRTGEGNLEAPTRHAVGWKNPDFYDETKCFQELERIFDICHGCRRCVSLCQSFPNLFDLVDVSADGEPGIGHDLLKLLAHNDIAYVLVDKEKCCGMPKVEHGDLDSVEKRKNANLPVLDKYAKDGFAISGAVPSCTLMFKQELPPLFPDDEAAGRVREAMWDPFEYLIARHKDGLLKTDFTQPLGYVSCHIPCHGRVQNIGKKTEEMFKLIGRSVAIELNTVERCSGHAGTSGVKKPYHLVAMKLGKPVFKARAKPSAQGRTADWISSDCALAGHPIEQGMANNQLPAAKLAHPLSLVRMAYRLA